MTISKTEYPKYINGISINNLLLNPNYPRLPKSKQGIDEAEVIKFMLLESAIFRTTDLRKTQRHINI